MPGKKNIIADLLSRIAEQTGYKNGALTEVPDSTDFPEVQLSAISLRGGKVLSPQLSTRKGKKSKSSNGTSRNTLSPKNKQKVVTATDIMPDSNANLRINNRTDNVSNQTTAQFDDVFTTQKYITAIKAGYKHDKLFQKALQNIETTNLYHLNPSNGLLYQKHSETELRLCIPDGTVRTEQDKKQESIKTLIIDHVHHVLGHFGIKKTLDTVS